MAVFMETCPATVEMAPPLNPPDRPPFLQPDLQLEQACTHGNALCSEFFAMALRPDGAWFFYF